MNAFGGGAANIEASTFGLPPPKPYNGQVAEQRFLPKTMVLDSLVFFRNRTIPDRIYPGGGKQKKIMA